MEDTTRTIVKHAGNIDLYKFCMSPFRVVVCKPGYLNCIPEQYFDFDAFAYCVTENVLLGEIMCEPERDIGFCEAFGS